MKPKVPSSNRTVSRRSFLTGAGAVAVGLPFLEGMPSRSAWAQDAAPVFTFFVVAQNGVVGKNFFPSSLGPISAQSLAGAGDVATAVLSPHAENLLFIKGIDYPNPGPRSCGHAEGNVQTLTGLAPGSEGNKAHSAGPSADTLISRALDGSDPIALYSGAKGFIAERISFKAGGPGQVRPADVNPYLLYSKVVGLAGASSMSAGMSAGMPAGPATTASQVAQEIANKRRSINDFVRGELKTLMGRPALSTADRQRLDQHFSAIRDIEVKMEEMATTTGAVCSAEGLPVDRYEAFRSGFAFRSAQMEEYVKLHLQITAAAFGCNYNRVATLQWGDGTDGTKYQVPSNRGLGWTFHQLSHRIQSDSASGNNPTAEAAHHEIDRLRMETLLVGLDAFKAHGLEQNTQLVWTNTIADGPSHSTRGVPMIVWGSGGDFLKQGVFLDARGAKNARILNTLMAAATQDAGAAPPAIGAGTYDDMKA
ncbi:MAG: DUF1552 domain-containing protein [Myxococcales bacterium]|nr:DUF1552 domain-containing protein [Myxococcales bacterium]